MLDILSTFAALSMAGTVLLSLLPDGGLKRTAGLAVGLLTIMCWAEGISRLLRIPFPSNAPGDVLIPTSWNVDAAIVQANVLLTHQWEAMP